MSFGDRILIRGPFYGLQRGMMTRIQRSRAQKLGKPNSPRDNLFSLFAYKALIYGMKGDDGNFVCREA